MKPSHYLGNNIALCMTEMGQKMFVDTRDTSITPHLLMEGRWEPWVTEAISPFLKNSTFFDVGANMGWFSLVAEHCGAKEIHAFEPNVELLRLINRTQWVNGYNWEIHGIALGDKDEELCLFFDEALMGGASLIGGRGNQSMQVPVKPLDDFYAGTPSGPVVIKLDVEGFEAKAAMGAQRMISEHDCTIFYEHHNDPNDERRVRDMFDMLEAQSYQISHIQKNGGIVPISRSDVPDVPEVDMLCFRRFSD